MGYNTKFDGEFKFSRKLTHTEAGILRDFYDGNDIGCFEGKPNAYLQWVVSQDRDALVYDGEEKFYEYIPWIEYLCKNYFEPWGVKVNGRVKWQGEDAGDIGVIVATDSQIDVFKNTHTVPGNEGAGEDVVRDFLTEACTLLKRSAKVLPGYYLSVEIDRFLTKVSRGC